MLCSHITCTFRLFFLGKHILIVGRGHHLDLIKFVVFVMFEFEFVLGSKLIRFILRTQLK